MSSERFGNMINREREGVGAVQNIVNNELGWVFREQTVLDFGIDAEIEIADIKRPTGKVIAVQIKSGDSYFQNEVKEGVTFRFDKKHKEYWLRHVLPVIILLYNPGNKECIWEVIDEDTVDKISDKSYKIFVPKENKFGCPTKEKLLILAYSNSIRDLAEEIDNLEVNGEILFSMLDENQQQIFSRYRKIFNIKNAAADNRPFEYNHEELSVFANTIVRSASNTNIIIGPQFFKLLNYIQQFIDSPERNVLIILGEAGSGKTTLIHTYLTKSETEDIFLIQPHNLDFVLDKTGDIGEIKNTIKTVIFDGWDEVSSGTRALIWQKLRQWQSNKKDKKIIITSRNYEKIWDKSETLRIAPLTIKEALVFLKAMTGEDFSNNESVMRLINIFNTPLMLKLLVMSAIEQGVPLQDISMDYFWHHFVSQYFAEEDCLLENLAFEMLKANKNILTINDDNYLYTLSCYKILCIEEKQVAFSHNMFFEMFVAKYAYRHIFKEEKQHQDFTNTVWNIFSNTLCTIDSLNCLKQLIKQQIVEDNFVEQLNSHFGYMLKNAMEAKISSDIEIFRAISNIFYVMWHIVSYVNRIKYGIFSLEKVGDSEKSLYYFISVFNKTYSKKVYLDFSYTDLSKMELHNCNLMNMNFGNSFLKHTNFERSCLDSSDFQRADLSYANLSGTDLRNANLKEAIFKGANVKNCMISESGLKYLLPYIDTLQYSDKLIIFMEDGTITYFC